MNKTEFLIGRSGLGLQDDFYPDDLPEDWRFDYYAATFKTLSLAIDTDEDLEQIFEDIKADKEEEFVLILTVEESQLTDAKILKELLSVVQGYKDDFILFCKVSKTPSAAIMQILSAYKICFQSFKALELDLQEVKTLELLLSFNQYPVLYTAMMWDDQEIRHYLESIKDVNTKTILICKFAERETLDKMRIISELLGY
jgi:hypothetical protein